jgi:IS1 family transposase
MQHGNEPTLLEQYVSRLKAHDWSYEMTDDGRVYQRGRAERAALNAKQKVIDPDFAIWNQHCPPDYRK